jgi:hypothetical protein
MESVALTIKFALFLAMEAFVVATVGAVLIAGLYQVIKDTVRESHHLDEIALEPAR